MREPLTVETLLPLADAEAAALVAEAFGERLRVNAKRRRPVLRSVWDLQRPTFILVVAVSLLHVAGSVGSPLVVRQLLLSLSGKDPHVGFYWAALLFVTALTASMTAHHIFHILLKMMIRVRIGLISAIYRKAMALTVQSRQAAPAGQIINLMGTDAQKFVNTLNVIHSVWVHPLQLILVLGILYWVLGPAAFAGAALLGLFLFVSTKVARRHVAARRLLVKHSDERVGLMNEILMSIRVIKFYAWEASFTSEVQEVRGREVKELSKLARLSAIATMIFLSTPIVVAVVTFGAYVLSGHALNAADVFSSLALFSVLRQAMVMLPDVVTTCLEANVAVGRMETFLELPELPPRPEIRGLAKGTVELRGATFEWTPGVTALQGVDLLVKPGELVAVIGQVGAGKSALIAALLGDLPAVAGTAVASGRIALVSQQAWITNDTIRNNVLFGEPYDAERYRRALSVSVLAEDLAQFPHGDLTEIGERGVNLSGGQRQRIALARAVYADADIVLLDDPLSALDNQVGQEVFEGLVLGALAGKTRILVTHRHEYASGADQLLVVEHGKITRSVTQGGSRVGTPLVGVWGQSPQNESPPPTTKQIMTDEERNTGVVGLNVYLMYLATFAPGVLAAALFVVFILKELLNAGTDSWLAYWSSATGFRLSLFLGGYLTLGLLACTSTWGRSLLISLRGLAAGTSFHNHVLTSVLRAPMSFFEGTPVGRILNRFSRDMEAIDQQIPRSLHEAIGCVFSITTTLIVIVAVSPIALVAIAPVALIYYQVQRFYRPASRESQRLDSITRSPIFAQFSESLAGVQVIRAFAAVPRFEKTLVDYLETNSRSFYTLVSANRWLGVRNETLGATIVAAAAFSAVLAGPGAGAGFVGLSVTYALAITGAMNWAVRMFSQLESNLNSVERLDHYSKLPAERWAGAPAKAAWPARGLIELDALELAYRPGLPPVLRGISCTVTPGEKLGVVGRTGAGKSTLLLALYRIVEPTAGRILIDGDDIARLDLAALRGALAIIPQDPVLFRGSIRKNLDPFARLSDAALWDALARAELADLVHRLPQGLDSGVHDGGSNFSVGQRQLLCLARAVLKDSRILLLDEATASVDPATDALIQKTIRAAFASATVITIAHRLDTIMDSDRIMVLDSGRIAELDSPAALLRKRGAFAALVREEREAVSEPSPVAPPPAPSAAAISPGYPGP